MYQMYSNLSLNAPVRFGLKSVIGDSLAKLFLITLIMFSCETDLKLV